jgi:iron(III) transport system substrate-binding protein
MRIRSRAGLFTKLLLVGSLVAVAAGCSNSKPTSSGSCTSSSPTSTSGQFGQVEAAAKSEGSVTVYTPTQQTILDAWTSGFKSAYPTIKLSIFRASPGQLVAKLAADEQGKTTAADVLELSQDGPTSTLATYDGQGKLATLAGPHFQDKDFRAAIESANRAYVYATVFGWAWNTQLLPNGIHGWNDFLSSNLANGKVAVWDPAITSAVPAFYNSGIAASGDRKYLQGLAAQKPGVYPGSEAMENAVASGEVAATMFGSKRVKTLADKGAPVGFAVPPQGAGVAGLETGILKTAPHPNAAQVFANWLASEDGQKCVLSSGTPARSNVPGNDIDFASLKPSVPVTPDQQKAFVAQFNALFQRR